MNYNALKSFNSIAKPTKCFLFCMLKLGTLHSTCVNFYFTSLDINWYDLSIVLQTYTGRIPDAIISLDANTSITISR